MASNSSQGWDWVEEHNAKMREQKAAKAAGTTPSTTQTKTTTSGFDSSNFSPIQNAKLAKIAPDLVTQGATVSSDPYSSSSSSYTWNASPTTVTDSSGKSWLSFNGQWYDPQYYEYKNGQIVQKTSSNVNQGTLGNQQFSWDEFDKRYGSQFASQANQYDSQIQSLLSQLNNQFSTLSNQLTGQYDTQVQNLIGQLQNAIANQPTVDDLMGSDAMQQMLAAIQGQTDQQMKQARADLASRGVLGEGSTPAAERYGQVAQQASQQIGSLIPSMLSTATQMNQGNVSSLQNLVNLLSGLDQQQYQNSVTDAQMLQNVINTLSGLSQQDWQRGITEFQATAPYYRLTAAQEAALTQWVTENFPALKDVTTEELMAWLESRS